MQAITIEQGEIRFRDDYPPPTPAGNEITVEVLHAGICETDLQLSKGYMGFQGVLGHEFVGVARSGRFAGQRVVGEINCNCQSCPRCQDAMGNHCDRRTVIGIDRHDGAFAEIVCVPEHCLHRVPDAISDDQAVFTEPLAAAFQILRQVNFKSDDRVIVLGDGRLAYLSTQAIATRVDRIDVVGKHAAKLERFGRLGVDVIPLADVQADMSYDVVVDCTGSSTGLPLALGLVRPRGTVVMKTTIAAEHQLSLAPVVIHELNLVGSRCGPFDVAIAALADRAVNVDELITDRFTLSEAIQAFSVATTPDAFKVVFDIQTGSPSA